MQELVTFIARELVDNPDKVEINRVEEEDRIILELRVDPQDMGKIIGKQGRIAKSIRSIVKAATARDEKPVYVDII